MTSTTIKRFNKDCYQLIDKIDNSTKLGFAYYHPSEGQIGYFLIEEEGIFVIVDYNKASIYVKHRYFSQTTLAANGKLLPDAIKTATDWIIN